MRSLSRFFRIITISSLAGLLIMPSSSSSTQDSGGAGCMPNRHIIDLLQITNETHYKKHVVPQFGMTVHLAAVVRQFSEINDVNQTFVLEMMMHEKWVDNRLAYAQYNPCGSNFSLGQNVLDVLWTPNTCFMNTQNAVIHASPFKNVIVLVFANGTVWSQYRTTVQGPCNVELAGFPMDKQTCFLTFESFSYSTDEVKMRWIEKPIYMTEDARWLADFYVSWAKATREPQPYPAGFWDEMTMSFRIERRYGWYILNVYVPTYLTVFISWISFCLGSKAIPARTMIGVNALLAMTFQFGSVIRNLPRVSYVKAIDVWMLTGMTFVFSSLLELAIIGWRTHLDEKKKEMADKQKNSAIGTLIARYDPQQLGECIARYQPGSTELGGCGSFRKVRYREDPPPEKQAAAEFSMSVTCACGTAEAVSVEKIDKFSSVLFPSLFAIFNIFYWSYYLSFIGDQSGSH